MSQRVSLLVLGFFLMVLIMSFASYADRPQQPAFHEYNQAEISTWNLSRWKVELLGKKIGTTHDFTTYAEADLPQGRGYRQGHRVIPHEAAILLDFEEHRLNVYLDEDGRVDDVRSTDMAKPTHVESAQHFSTLLQTSRIVVTDFYADWCGPCKSIAPIYEALSTQLSRPNVITFTKVNVDHQKQIAQMYGITAMPTFMIFKAGRETKRIQGANVKELDAAIKSLAQEATSSGEASSSASGGKGWIGATIPKGYEDVTDQVDQRSLDFLNLDSDAGSAKAIFTTDKPSALNAKGKAADVKDWIESDTDEELMLFIPFQSTMKLHTLHLTSIPSAGEDDAPMRPKTLHLYTNRTTVLGFDEAADTQSTQTIVLQESDYDKQTGTAKIELRFVKFQNISSLVVFVADGLGDGEKTRIDRLRLLGEAGEKKTMGKLEKIGHEQGE